LDIRKRKFKVHSLTGRITRKVMDKSFKAVKRNRGAAGIDKVSIEMFEANIVLNYLDWKLHAEGYKFVRYADDFVVLCRTRAEAEKALAFVRCILEDLGLQLHPEKTCVVRFSQGIDFLGFALSNQSRRMRHKAAERYKMKIRDLTVRSHNLDAQVIVKLNRVIRGTLNYFGAGFATGAYLFRQLDKWTRKRIRCMKYRRISQRDYRLRKKHIARMRLLSACELFHAARGRTTRSP